MTRINIKNRTHFKTNTPEYRIWRGMKSRCYNSNERAYPRYGGRGIKICDRWMDSFENFLSDMGERPSKDYSIDRICNDGDYSPENCRWATRKEQASNYSRNVLVEYKGETKTLKDWCDQFGLNYGTTRARLKIYEYTPEEAFNKGYMERKHDPYNYSKAIILEVDGVKKPFSVWCKELNLNPKKIYPRISKLGWTHKQALGLEERPYEKPICKNTYQVLFKGELVPLHRLAKKYGVPTRTARYRIENKGMSVEEALGISE